MSDYLRTLIKGGGGYAAEVAEQPVPTRTVWDFTAEGEVPVELPIEPPAALARLEGFERVQLRPSLDERISHIGIGTRLLHAGTRTMGGAVGTALGAASGVVESTERNVRRAMLPVEAATVAADLAASRAGMVIPPVNPSLLAQLGGPEAVQRQEQRRTATEAYNEALSNFSEPARQYVMGVAEQAEETYAGDPRLQGNFWWDQVPAGIGSFGAFIAASALSRGAGAGMAAFGGIGEQRERLQPFVEDGALTAAQANRISELGAGPGIIQILPVLDGLAQFTKKPVGGFINRITTSLVQGGVGATEEAIVESIGQAAQNFIEQQAANPDLEVMDGVTNAAASGGAVGFAARFLLAALRVKGAGGKIAADDVQPIMESMDAEDGITPEAALTETVEQETADVEAQAREAAEAPDAPAAPEGAARVPGDELEQRVDPDAGAVRQRRGDELRPSETPEATEAEATEVGDARRIDDRARMDARERQDREQDIRLASSTRDELQSILERGESDVRAAELAAIGRVLGEESATAAANSPGQRAREFNKIDESDLTPQEWNAIFTPDINTERVGAYIDARDFVEASAQEGIEPLAQLVARSLIKIGPADIANLNSDERLHAFRIAIAGQEAVNSGIDPQELANRAVSMAAREFSDPADAEFMLRQFIASEDGGEAGTPASLSQQRALPPSAPLSTLTYAQLRQRAKEMGLPATGKKAEILARVQEASTSNLQDAGTQTQEHPSLPIQDQGPESSLPAERETQSAEGATPPTEVQVSSPQHTAATGEGKQPWEMQQADYVSELRDIQARVDVAEKHGPMTPEQENLLGLAMREGRWEEFSRARGYTEQEISEFRRWLELAPLDGIHVLEFESDALIHRQHVERALAEGRPVPPEVLADYPELAAKVESEAEADSPDAGRLRRAAMARRGFVDIDLLAAPVRAAVRAGKWTADSVQSGARWLWHLGLDTLSSARRAFANTFGTLNGFGRIWSAARKMFTGQYGGNKLPNTVSRSNRAADPELILRFGRAIRKATPAPRAEYEAIKRAHRRMQAARLHGIRERASGAEAVRRSLGALKGEIAKPAFESLQGQFTPAEIDSLIDHGVHHQIFDSRPLSGANLGNQVLAIFEHGVLPDPAVVATMEVVYGPQVAAALAHKFGSRTLRQVFYDVWNVPKSMVASMDLSATLRQGWKLGTMRPDYAAKAYARQLKAFASEEYARDLDMAMRGDRLFDLSEQAGLYISHVGESVSIADREEQYMSTFASRLFPGVRQSERAYLTYLNQMRYAIFKWQAQRMLDAGQTIETDEAAFRSLAHAINAMSGRGNLSMGDLGPILNGVFFSPKYTISHFESPFRMAVGMPMHKGLKLFAAWSLTSNVGAVLGIAYAMSVAAEAFDWDLEVILDPLDPRFGRIAIGKNTTIDITGGQGPLVRAVAQTLTGLRTDPQTGRQMKSNALMAWAHFLYNKKSPSAGIVASLITGERFAGASLDATIPGTDITVPYGGLGVDAVVPITFQELFEVTEEHGAAGLWLMIPEIHGASVQIYEPKESGSGRSTGGRRGTTGRTRGVSATR